jgi:glycosyltransferase involved in cell wall biosynthesis
MLLGVASRWSDRKGLSDMLELAALVRRRKSEGRSSRGYRIVLVGLSSSQLRALPEDVVGLPRTASASELAEIYTAADYFVNATHEDNYPTVNLEAMACGTPVITYNTGGSGECLIDERFGRVVSSNTPEGMLEVVESCGLSHFEVDHSVAGVVSAERQLVRYLGLYKDVITASRSPYVAGMAVR